MKNFVLDASIALSWCFIDETTKQTRELLEKLNSEVAYVPAIWRLEISNILLLAERKKRISHAEVMQFLSLLENINIKIDNESNNRWLHDVMSLAYTEKLTTYDSAYLELAIRLGLPLATKDKALQKAAIRLGMKLAI